MRSFNPWASYLMQGQYPPITGILSQDFAGAPMRRLPPPGPQIGIGLRPMPDPGMPEANLPGTADRMPQFGAAPSTSTWGPPLGGRGMATMLPSSPPVYGDEKNSITPGFSQGGATPPFDLGDWFRRLYGDGSTP